MTGSGSSLRGSRVLVTGASGFIGRRLCRRLVAAGARVHGTSRTASVPGAGLAGTSRGDLSDPDFVRGLLDEAEPRLVYHLASRVTGSRDPGAVLPTLRGNLESTVNLLLAVSGTGCRRIVLAGSMEEPEPDGEGGAPLPQSPYAAAKWAASAYARMFHALYETPAVIARLFMAYGPEQHDLRKLVPYVVLSLLRGETPRLSSGARPVDWIYVDDAVEGLLALGTARGVEGRRVDLGSGRLVTVRETVEELARIAGSDSELGFGELPDRPLEAVRRADVRRTRELLGWQAETDLAEGLRRTVEWYREALGSGRLRTP